MNKYRICGRKGEGTFSEVLRAESIHTNKQVAIKCMKNRFESVDKVNKLREIQALRRLCPHPNIVQLVEVLYDRPTGRLALVFELLDQNIYELIKGRKTRLPMDKLLGYMYQLMKAMDHMHRNGIFHRDIKPENVLVVENRLKLADFGSCRGIHSEKPFTEYISTRWYRAPECLLTNGYYDEKMDMWGVGCVFFEIVALQPLFPGNNELDQINRIHKIIGTPSKSVMDKIRKVGAHIKVDFPKQEGTGIRKLLPGVSEEGIDLIERLLAYDPDERLTAREALRHPFFREIREKEKMSRRIKRTPADGQSLGSVRTGGGSSATSGGAAGRSHRGRPTGAGDHMNGPSSSTASSAVVDTSPSGTNSGRSAATSMNTAPSSAAVPSQLSDTHAGHESSQHLPSIGKPHLVSKEHSSPYRQELDEKSSVPGLSEKVPVVAQTKSSQLYQKHRQQQLLQQQPPPPPGQNPQHAYHYQSHHSGVGISQSKVSPQHSNAGSGSGGSSGMYHPMKEYRSPYAQSVKSSVSQNKSPHLTIYQQAAVEADKLYREQQQLRHLGHVTTNNHNAVRHSKLRPLGEGSPSVVPGVVSDQSPSVARKLRADGYGYRRHRGLLADNSPFRKRQTNDPSGARTGGPTLGGYNVGVASSSGAGAYSSSPYRQNVAPSGALPALGNSPLRNPGAHGLMAKGSPYKASPFALGGSTSGRGVVEYDSPSSGSAVKLPAL